MTDMLVSEEVLVVTERADDDPIYTHIIDSGSSDIPAKDIILEARINGTPIKALCGYIWIPQRDPMKYPPCEVCVEMWQFAKDFKDQ